MPLSPWKSSCLAIASAIFISLTPCYASEGLQELLAMNSGVQQKGPQELLLEVTVNHELKGTTMLLLKEGRLFIHEEDLKAWRLILPDRQPFLYNGRNYYPLEAFSGISVAPDVSTQTLSIDAPSALFTTTSLATGRGEYMKPTAPPWGGFFNYDIFAQQTGGADGTFHALGEAGIFNGFGVGLASFLMNEARVIRLDTQWIKDMPERLMSLRVGDGISRGASIWGRSIRFSGIQVATNFSTQPGIITFAQPAVRGAAVLPSVVDLYVDDVLRLHKEVPPGPFFLPDPPLITGQGDVRMVVKDMLGREQIISQAYYVSPVVLRKGLSDFSYETGFVRENYGLKSNDYGRWLLSGTHRHGFSDVFTGEIHGELQIERQTIGAGGSLLLSDLGVFSFSAAGSRRSDDREGILGSLGFQRQTKGFSFGGQLQAASRDFSFSGLQADEKAPRIQAHAFTSFATKGFGSFGLGYTLQDYRDKDDVEFISGSYGVSVGKVGYLNLNALKFLKGGTGVIASAMFTLPLENSTSLMTNVTVQEEEVQALSQIQKNLPRGNGFGYRILAGVTGSERIEAGISARGPVGTYSLEASQVNGAHNVRAGLSGGLAFIDNGLFLSRKITDSFCLVDTAGYKDIPVYADNQLVGTTNSEGKAFIPDLRPYQKNPVAIDGSALPMDTKVDSLRMDMAPYFRSGVVARFAIGQSMAALVRVILENGSALPAGTVVKIEGNEDEFFAGFDGEVYLTGLARENRLYATWKDQTCRFSVSFQKSDDPLPHLGTFVCRGGNP